MKRAIEHIKPEVVVYDDSLYGWDISGLVQGLTIRKSVEGLPVMSVELNPSRDAFFAAKITYSRAVAELKKRIRSNTMISVKMDKSYKKYSFFGFIDHVFESKISEKNSTRRSVALTCSMLFPKMFLRDDVINSPVLAADPKIKQELGERAEFFKYVRGLGENGESPFAGPPEKAVKWILEKVPVVNNGIITNDPPNPSDRLKMDAKDYKGDSIWKFSFLENELLFAPDLSIFSGNILQYMKSCIDTDYYELFFDTTADNEGLPTNEMIIRTKPFSYKGYTAYENKSGLNGWTHWEDLPPVEVRETERLQEDLGISDYELKNFFSANFTMSLIANNRTSLGKYGLQFPILNMDSIKRYGLRAMQLNSKMLNTRLFEDKMNEEIKKQQKSGSAKITVPTLDTIAPNEQFKSGSNGTWLDHLLAKREKGVEWFAFPYYESGQLTIPAREDIGIGQRLVYKGKNYVDIEKGDVYDEVEYYIAGITETYFAGIFHKQTLRLVHGAPAGLPAKWLNENRSKFLSIDTMISGDGVVIDVGDIEKRISRIKGMV